MGIRNLLTIVGTVCLIMRKPILLLLAMTPLLVSQSPTQAQSIMEAGGVHGAAAGLGAGLAAGATRAYESRNVHARDFEDGGLSGSCNPTVCPDGHDLRS